MMITSRNGARSRGFTLIELAIGIGVMGLLFAGVWELLGTMNQQLQDQAIARQTQAVTEAAIKYTKIEKPQILTWPANTWVVVGVKDDPATPIKELQPDYMPTEASDTNALGQKYKVLIKHDGSGKIETFVVASTPTTGPEVSDVRASRIAGMIGADGGAIYSDDASLILGSYGGWAKNVSDFNTIIPMGKGDIVVGTMFAASDIGAPYLYRDKIDGHPEYNQMNTDINMKDNAIRSLATLTSRNNGTSYMEFVSASTNILHPSGTTTPTMLTLYGNQGVTGTLETGSNVRIGCSAVFACATFGAQIEANGNVTIGNAPGKITMNATTGALTTAGMATIGQGASNLAVNLRVTGRSEFSSDVTVNGGQTTLNSTLQVSGTRAVFGNPSAAPSYGGMFITYPYFEIYSPSTTFKNKVYFENETHLKGNVYGNPATGGIAFWHVLEAHKGVKCYGWVGDCTADYSDIRLKKNVAPLKNALDKLLTLKGVSFEWKKDSRKSIGLIAQDVEKVYPEIVIEPEDGIKRVFYPQLIGPVIEAIRELKADLDSLHTTKADAGTVEALTAENAALRLRIEALEKRLDKLP